MGEKAGLANAAYDLYRDQQMAQVAKNDQGLDELLNFYEANNQKKQLASDRRRLRTELGRGGINARRYSNFINKATKRETEINDATLNPQRIDVARGKNAADMADASARYYAADSKKYAADATRYKADTEAGLGFARLASEEDRADRARFYSPKEANDAILRVVEAGEYPDQLLNNPEFMRQAENLVMNGMDARDVMDRLAKRALGQKQGV